MLSGILDIDKQIMLFSFPLFNCVSSSVLQVRVSSSSFSATTPKQSVYNISRFFIYMTLDIRYITEMLHKLQICIFHIWCLPVLSCPIIICLCRSTMYNY
ncbi:hypothetical protein AABB24_018761 [Solanum stoloniferum]|uniref:Uncharacterized protein n=1 Tax=Solanum stoloniferum TaxID=62892 RepID=A0ABD2TDP5_9SOLN